MLNASICVQTGKKIEKQESLYDASHSEAALVYVIELRVAMLYVTHTMPLCRSLFVCIYIVFNAIHIYYHHAEKVLWMYDSRLYSIAFSIRLTGGHIVTTIQIREILFFIQQQFYLKFFFGFGATQENFIFRIKGVT